MQNRKSDITTISLSDEQRHEILEEIHNFFDEEYGEDIGIIKQTAIMDFFLERLAPIAYNKALDDAMRMVKRQQDNFEADYYSLYKQV